MKRSLCAAVSRRPAPSRRQRESRYSSISSGKRASRHASFYFKPHSRVRSRLILRECGKTLDVEILNVVAGFSPRLHWNRQHPARLAREREFKVIASMFRPRTVGMQDLT